MPDGKAPFVNFFTEKFQKNPQAKNEIKRAIAEGNLVVLHVHSTENEKIEEEQLLIYSVLKMEKS